MTKAAKPHTVKLCRLWCVTLRPNASACLGVSPSRSAPWASPSIDVGFGNLRFEVSRYTFGTFLLSTKAKASHYLMVALDVCTLQIIEQTASLRDHLEQAAPRVIVLFMDFEMFGELVDPLAEQSYLNLW